MATTGKRKPQVVFSDRMQVPRPILSKNNPRDSPTTRSPMPLSNLMKSAAGTCPFCRRKAGILSREHQGCRRTHRAGWDEMVELAAQVAKSHEFNPNSLQVSLTEIAKRSYGDTSTVARALEEGWRRAVRHAAADGSITHEEEFRLQRFRDRLGLSRSKAHALCNGTTEPDIQAEAHGADPSRRRHCRRRRPPSETTFRCSPEGRVRVAGIVHTAV